MTSTLRHAPLAVDAGIAGTDSLAQRTLVGVPAYRDTVRATRGRLFDRLEPTGGMQVPLRRGDGQAAEWRIP